MNSTFVLRTLAFGSLLLCTLTSVWGQTDSMASFVRGRFIPVFGFEVRNSYVPGTNEFLEGVNANNRPIDYSVATHLRLGLRFHPDSRIGQLYPECMQGIGIGKTTFFDKEQLGDPFSIYVFQTAPIYRFSRTFSIHYEWNFGAALQWKPYGPDNTYNHVIGSKSNFYLNTSFYADFRLNRNLRLQFGPTLSHYSNGNTAFPNTGVNEIGLRGGLSFETSDALQKPLFRFSQPTFTSQLEYDLLLFGSWKRKGVYLNEERGIPLPQKFAVMGFNFSPLYHIARRWRVGGSLDFVYDRSYGVTLLDEIVAYGSPFDYHYTDPPAHERMAVGLSARGEFVMPLFAINVGLGINLYHKNKDARGFYQILGLKTTITRHVYLYTGYSLHNFSEPNHLMFGLGYRFFRNK